MKRIFIAFFFFVAAAGYAQHQHEPPKPPAPAPPAPQSSEQKPEPQPEQHQHPQPQQPTPDQHAGHEREPERDAPAGHARTASGTAWQPLSTPAHMWMARYGAWNFMAHGNIFLTFNHQGGPRGVGKFESMNWVMFMQERKVGPGTLEFRQMLSAEALTAPHGGFPQLLQTGETYRGEAIVDAQHPHDLFGELSAQYSVKLTERVGWHFYGGIVGEPALGPVAFMHRGSAAELPAAPLGHHLQDSTHITPGILTTGLTFDRVRFEGSVFNGREPDERRHTIDLGPLDSWAARVSVELSRHWTAQYSYGKLVEPEAAHPGDIKRQTASLSYNHPFRGGNLAATLLWGRNRKVDDLTTQNSYLLESSVNFQVKNYAYTRLELLDRDELFHHGEFPHGTQFRIGAYTFGGVRDLVQNDKWQMGLGADVTFYSKPVALNAFYGEKPVSFRVFLRLRPGMMKH